MEDASRGGAPGPAAAPAGRAARSALAALALAVCAAGALPGYIPTHDGPQHVFGVHVANRLAADAADATGWSEWLEPARPVTSLGFAALFAPLDRWLPWPLALRIATTALALGWLFAAWSLARALDPARAWLGLALGGAAYSWAFYMGFFSFYAGCALGLGVIALALHRDTSRPRELALLAAGLLAVALCHVWSAFATGLVLASLVGFRATPGARARAVLGAVALGLPAAALALATVSVGAESMALWNAQPGETLVASGGLAPAPWWTLGRCFTGGPAWRAWPLTGLALAALGVAARDGFRRRPEERALLAAGALSLAAAALAPLDLAVWDLFAPRFLPIGVGALVVTLPLERLRGRALGTAAAALAGFALASTAWAGAYHRELALRTRDALSGLAQPIARSGVRLPIVFEPAAAAPVPPARAPMPYALPLLNLGPLYAAQQGGITPYGFTLNPRIHHLLLREDAAGRLPPVVDRAYVTDLTKPGPAADAVFRAALLTHLASRAVSYEDVIFYGRPEEADLLRELGFDEDWRQRGLSIARFRGCPLDVWLSPRAARGGAASFEVGWAPSGHPSGSYDAAQGERAADGAHALRLRQTCGALWLRLQHGADACEGADAEGRLLAPSVRDAPRLVCRLPGERWAPPARSG